MVDAESVPSAWLVAETQVIPENEPGCGDLIRPLDSFKILPVDPVASSHRLGWVGLEAVRYRASPAFEFNQPALSYQMLVLFARPPEELDVRYERVKRHVPPPAGSVLLLRAGSPARVRSGGHKDEVHVFLEPGLVGHVAAEVFGLDPAWLTVPPIDGLGLPNFRAVMWAVDAELTGGGAGGRLASESLANVLAVHLLRHVVAPRRPERGPDGTLPRGRLRAVLEYIEEHAVAGPTLEQMAAVARLSPYHFARQFKKATGLPPHQYVILRRVEWAKQLLQAKPGLSLAEVAARAGFSDQSQFGYHFKRLAGVTPGQFRTPARTPGGTGQYPSSSPASLS
jgi:AraC family transcriptional regulator